MSDGTITGVIVLAVLLLAGFGLYYVGAAPVLAGWWRRIYAVAGPILKRWWERYKQNRATRKRERVSGIEVPVTPAVALESAVETMTRKGYTLDGATGSTATFARHEGANAGLGCLLMLLFLVPGLLYLLLAGKTVRVTLAAYPRDEGGSRVVIGGDDEDAVEELTQWARRMKTVPE